MPAERLVIVWRFLRRRPTGLAGLIIVLAVLLVGMAAPLIAPHSPREMALLNRLRPPAWSGGERDHILGTDGLGRDLLSRLIHGARVSLLVAFTAVAIAGAIGVTVGLVSGYFGGYLETVLMRIVDIQLAIPPLVLYLAIIALTGPSLRNLVLVLGLTNWVDYSRIIYGETLSVRQRQFVEAARAIGTSDLRILLGHVLRNVVAPAVIVASLQAGRVVLEEASLSFLGLGVQPPTPSWGGMVADGLEVLDSGWWVSTIPGLVILVTVLGLNLFGDWIRDYLDPRTRRRHV